ncbi:pantoate--beta-alanine ligase [Frankia sp. QA3]|uniref:pantoate--beta-alanine ligase n=1 Tax=Frankia sp. QA3 TaxID=710111 RepID=UPI000269BECE|nr:pantoate--beta-alanine ligase [Frankia sp. QA3]EIV91915.1 panthothenate synthetase [Frankia sp. QA3]
MITTEKHAEVRELLDAERAAGRRVAMVGTSGGTHSGHISLVEQAKKECDVVAVFWNGALKLEWASGGVQAYNRDLAHDQALFEAAGVDVFYIPLRHDLYQRPSNTFLAMPGMLRHLTGMPEGEHMELLVTMVATLLNIAGPCTTFFGEKDWQQLVMFQRMAEDLHLPSRVVGCPTRREPDGVAISSRNTKLSPEQRAAAPALYAALTAAADAIAAGERDAHAAAEVALARLRPVADPDYVVAVEAATLRPLDTLDPGAEGGPSDGEVRLLASVRFGTTPLVDNIGVTVPTA